VAPRERQGVGIPVPVASLETGTIRDRGGAMDDKDMQLAKVVELFTKFSKDGWRLSEGAVPCFRAAVLSWWVG